MEPSDRDLVTRTLSGNKHAFSLLVERYQGMVCGLAYHKVGNLEDARDLAQEVFVHAYRSLPKLKDPSKFAHWLYSIALNTCISWLRRRRPETVALESEMSTNTLTDTSPSPEEILIDDERRSFVREAISNLPEPHRLAVTLYYMDGMSVPDISGFLGIPAGTVKSRLYNARKQLKGNLMAMVEQTLKEQKPGREFTEELASRLNAALMESTAILTRLLQTSTPDREDIERMRRLAEQFSPAPSVEMVFKDQWQQIFDNLYDQKRELAFEQAMQLLYQSTGLDNWGWQLYALATLDVLKLMELDVERKPQDINILMGYLAGQHAMGGRFEWRSSDWHCVSWGDIGLHEGFYRTGLKFPMERLAVGTQWYTERPAFQDEGSLYETTVEADDDRVVVPVGTFGDCLRVVTKVYASRLGKRTQRQQHTLWLAPGVGVVKYVAQGLYRPDWKREVALKECFISEPDTSYFPLQIGSCWHYEWDDPGFHAPTAEVYRLLCQKGEEFYFSRARYIYGNYADSEVGKIVAKEKDKN